MANFITAFGTLGLATVAGFALHTWKKEFIGKKRIDLACQIMESVFYIRDLIFLARSTTEIEPSDYFYLLEGLEETKAKFPQGALEIHKDKLCYLMPYHRLIEYAEKIDQFLALQNKAQLYWDDNIIELFNELHLYLHQIQNASKAAYNSPVPEQSQEMLSIMWDDTRNDNISRRVTDIVKEFKLNLEPVYKNQKTPWKKLEWKT